MESVGREKTAAFLYRYLSYSPVLFYGRRLSAILKDRLDESGWMDDVSNKAKEYALQQDPLHFKTLVQELTPNAEATVPADIKEEITSLLRTWIDENTEN
ncbi:SAGA histone acetylase and TREX-2 complexes component [Tulasnella sp. JGI-2019a]|nr:SAGA histone acetylase and TREX-2 complexes component [Tulasnella sp. JGI-2019a]